MFKKLIRVCFTKFEEIKVLRTKSPLDLQNADLNLFLKLFKMMVEENQLFIPRASLKAPAAPT
ncbi:hypothetical protein L0F63_003947, partial [Massospora cicadina]